MIVLNTIFPLLVLLVLGNLLKLTDITNDVFLKTADRLIYYIFFPAMLFWKLGSSDLQNNMEMGLIFSALMAIGIVFGISLICIKEFGVTNFQAGSFIQAGFRFNTYIGMAVVMATLGEEGVRAFGILVGMVIPVVNALSVSSLIWYSGQDLDLKKKQAYLIKALLSNPLILGCLAGLMFSKMGFVFPKFLHNSFELMTQVTLPLALISIGGSLHFSSLKGQFRISMLAALMKLLLLPVTGFVLLKLFQVSGVAFKTGLIFFCLPTSTAIYVLSGQLNSDTRLASAAIMLSTLLSFASLSIALFFC